MFSSGFVLGGHACLYAKTPSLAPNLVYDNVVLEYRVALYSSGVAYFSVMLLLYATTMLTKYPSTIIIVVIIIFIFIIIGIINLSIGSPYSVQSALDFLYGKIPAVDLNTAYNLLETADFLMIDELMRLCEKKIKSFTVSSQSCLTLLFISSRFDISIPKLEDFYLSHLPELMKQDQMLEIDKEAVRLLLTDQSLSYIGKGNIITFLLRWASFHYDRKSDFAELLSYLEKDDFTAEIMTTVHGTYPDLEKLIDDLHSGYLLTNSEVTQSIDGYETIVIYPPDKKLSTRIFHGYSLEHKCWFKIPVKSDTVEKDGLIVAKSKDTIYTLDMCTETMSVFNIASGQSYQKNLVFQEGAHILAFQVPMTVSEETIFIAKNFNSIVLNTDAGNVSHYDGPPDLIRFETKSTVYASANIENPEIYMEPLFSVDIQVDKMCVAGNLLCLLSHTSHQLIVYCLKKKLRAAIKLPPCSLPDKDGIFTSSGNHVYILANGFIVDIEFQTLPKKILWKEHTIFPNELFFSPVVLFRQIMQDRIIGQTQDDETQTRTLKWQNIGSEKVPAASEPVYDIDIPEKIAYTDKHRLMNLKLPKDTLKCHIDCPHCKDKDAEQLDLFSYQESFSSGEESAGDEQEDWSDEDLFDDPDLRHLYDSDDSVEDV